MKITKRTTLLCLASLLATIATATVVSASFQLPTQGVLNGGNPMTSASFESDVNAAGQAAAGYANSAGFQNTSGYVPTTVTGKIGTASTDMSWTTYE